MTRWATNSLKTSKIDSYKIFSIVTILIAMWPLVVPTATMEASNALIKFLVSTEIFFLGIFLFDFIMRIKVFKKHYVGTFLFWLELITLASFIVPVLIPALSWMVGLRVFKALRLLTYSATFQVIGYVYRLEKRFMASIALVVVLTVFIGALLIFQPEHAAQPENFQTFGDALFYSAITMTTIGYGNLVAATPFGQTVSFLLSVAGIILIALPTTLITARMISIKQQNPDKTFEEFFQEQVEQMEAGNKDE